QAWAAGALFMLLRAMLGIEADAPHHRLTVAPALPDWLTHLDLHNLRIGNTRLHLHFWREGSDSCWKLVDQHGDETIEVTDGRTGPPPAPLPERTGSSA